MRESRQDYIIIFLLILKEWFFAEKDLQLKKIENLIWVYIITIIASLLILIMFVSVRYFKTNDSQLWLSLLFYTMALIFGYAGASSWVLKNKNSNFGQSIIIMILIFSLPLISAYNGRLEGYKILLDDMNGSLVFDETNTNINILKNEKYNYIDNPDQNLILYSPVSKNIIFYKLSPSDLFSLKKLNK